MYGAVDEKFVIRLKKEFGDASYHFESASGYTLAQLLERMAIKMQQEKSNDALRTLATVEYSGLPLIGLEYLDNAEFGRHFEMEGFVYRAKG